LQYIKIFLAARKVQDQVGLDAFITTHDSGSLVEAYLKWNIVIDGPNKNTAYHTSKFDLSRSTLLNSTGLKLKDGSVFDEATSGGGVFARIKSQELAGTADTSATYLDKEAAADSIQANPPTSNWVLAIDEKQYGPTGTLIVNAVTLILVQCAATAPALNSISTTGLRGVIIDPNDYVLPLN
jgi:hypothetical protein